MNVNIASGLSYNVTSTVSTSTVQVGPNNGTTYKLKQLPQIIYLGRNDLYWQNGGLNQNPPIPLTILLDDANPSAPKLLIDPLQLAYIDTQPAGATYSIPSISVSAPSGYYWNALPIITGLPSYLGVAGITLGSGTYPTTININFNVIAPLGHPSTATTLTLGIDTTGLFSAAAAQMQLTMTGAPGNTTVSSPPFIQNITYNFATGYTYNIVCNAISGYRFIGNPPPSIASLSGGGTYTINSTVYTNLLAGGGHGTITMNVTITGVPVGTTNLIYGLTVPVVSASPRITYWPTGYIIQPINGSAYHSKPVHITNNTGSSVWIWFGINQYMTTGSGQAYIQGGYAVYFPSISLTANTGTSNQTNNLSNGQYFSGSYELTNGSTFMGDLYRAYTLDSAHDVQMWWSASATSPPSQRYTIQTA
jgi:hypothetical protein